MGQVRGSAVAHPCIHQDCDHSASRQFSEFHTFVLNRKTFLLLYRESLAVVKVAPISDSVDSAVHFHQFLKRILLSLSTANLT